MEAYIYGGTRTARGRVGSGTLAQEAPLTLVSSLLAALDAQTGGLKGVQEMTLGCVTQTGAQGGNIARTALLHSGVASAAFGTVINSFCCSGLDACLTAGLKAQHDPEGLYLAGGVESMSQVFPFSDKGPYYSDPAIMQKTAFSPMWLSADFVATHAGVTRAEADAYAAASQQRAAAARQAGAFRPSITPIGACRDDETIRGDTTADALADLPAFQEKQGQPGGDDVFLAAFTGHDRVAHIHHVGSAPALADAAALLLIGSKEAGTKHGLTPRAKIRAARNLAGDPVLSLTGGIDAARETLGQAGMTIADIDLIEFNEAYAAVCIACMRELGADHDRFNVNGGAIALGHPMGATGGILLLTLLDALERRDLNTGLVALSGAAGLGTAMIIERV